jgi:thiamine monophosphate synthase
MIDPPRPPAEWRLVLVADPALAAASAIVETIRSVLESGAVDAIVLRLPGRPLREVLAITSQVRPLATASGAALLSHDRADLALGLGTDGVHLPAAGLPPAFAI